VGRGILSSSSSLKPFLKAKFDVNALFVDTLAEPARRGEADLSTQVCALVAVAVPAVAVRRAVLRAVRAYLAKGKS